MSTDPRWYAALPESGPGPSERWTSADFATELHAWVGGALGSLGHELVALEPVHQRPWSTVWRARAGDGGLFWAKQNCAHQSFEAHLLIVLDRLAGDRVVPVAAADIHRGLHLVPDQGPVYAETVPADDIDAWCTVAVEAMHLQRELLGREAELAAAGLTRIRTAEVAEYVTARASSLAGLPADDPRRMPADEAAKVCALDPVIRGWAAQVEALDLPDTLVHNDLHGHNVFATDGQMRFFDFGDAVLANPLWSLLIPLRVMSSRLEAGVDDPRLRRVADAATEVWGDLRPVGELRAALPAALQLARLGRVEAWLRVVATMTPSELADFGDSPSWWLASLQEEPPLR
ncbi:phosphotransferase [Monashia sp. NPDC004114]